MTTFLFVGERPSRQAVRIGATWQNGKLAGRTLRECLASLNIDPTAQTYMNLWRGAEPHEADQTDEQAAIADIWRQHAQGSVIVGMGHLVCRVLRREGVPHLQMIHPAARGKIRLKERYRAHVASILGTAPKTPWR